MTNEEVGATLEDAAAMAVRLLEFVNHAAKVQQRNKVVSANAIGYSHALNDIRHFVIEGHPLPPEDA